MIKKLIEPQQYSEQGIYMINLFFDDEWQQVVIDDFIPMQKDDNPTFARSIDLNETWVMLVEKAYAKLHGSYQALESAHSLREAMEHLTAGFADSVHLFVYIYSNKVDWFATLQAWHPTGIASAIVWSNVALEEEQVFDGCMHR